MLGFIFYSHTKLIKVCDHVSQHCEKIEESLNNNDLESAYKYSLEIKNHLEENSTPIAIYVNHTDINNINNEVIRLSQYIKKKEMPEAYASVHTIKYSCKYIHELESVSMKNIF